MSGMRIFAVALNSPGFPNFYGRCTLPVLDLAAKKGNTCFIYTGDSETFRLANCDKEFIFRKGNFIRAFYKHRIGKLIDRFKPDIILPMPDQLRIGRVTCELAKKRGIVTATWHAALLSGHPSYNLPITDAVFYGGDSVAMPFIKRGYQKERVRITGHVFLDHVKYSREHGNAVMFATENIHTEATRFALLQTMKECRRANRPMILKLHPREPRANFVDMIPDDFECVIMGHVADNSYGLYGSSHVVVNESALGLEALLAGCKLITYDPGGTRYIDYAKEGAAHPLQPGFLDLPEAPHVEEFIQNWNFGQGGRATERTLEYIEEIVYEKPRTNLW